MKVIYKTYLIDNDFYKSSSSGKKCIWICLMLFYKIDCVYDIAVIDKDFYKSSSSGKKMHLDTLNAIFIKLVVFMTSQ